MAKKLSELAATLVDGGLSLTEIKHAMRPKKEKVPVKGVQPKPQPKRYREVVQILLEHPERTNEQIVYGLDATDKFIPNNQVGAVASMTLELVAAIRAEVEAVKAELKDLSPIDASDPPEEVKEDDPPKEKEPE